MSRPPETLTIEESEQLLQQLKNCQGEGWTKWKSLRNYTMALLMLDAGLRVGEVARLKITHLIVCGVPVGSLDMTDGLAEKKCTRLIPLSNRILEAAEKMMKLIWTAIPNDNEHYAFFDGNALEPLSTRQIQRIIGRAAKAGFGRKIHPHVLRHTFATRLMRVTSQAVVQQLLGHKNLSSTQVYQHPNGDDCKKAIEKLQ